MSTIDHRAIDVTTTLPLTHESGLDLFAVELQRHLDLMESLDPSAWAMPTECPDWDVRRMYLHLLGACESGASMRELGHQMMTAFGYRRRNGGPLEAALSATQVADRISLDPAQITERWRVGAPKTIAARRRLPALVRRATMSVDGPVVEKWSLGYLVDTIYLRDAWMHRVDVTRAVGRPMTLTAEHDGRIVGDVVAEWARRHGQPFTLVLTGTAGGTFAARGGAPDAVVTLDAVEFCRILAGRAPGTGVLEQIVPF